MMMELMRRDLMLWKTVSKTAFSLSLWRRRSPNRVLVTK
jgi:hypothetical protein